MYHLNWVYVAAPIQGSNRALEHIYVHFLPLPNILIIALRLYSNSAVIIIDNIYK